MAGYRLKQCRTERNYTQKEIAEVLKCTRECYTQYESGRRDIPPAALIALADFYDCSTDELLGSEYYYKLVRFDTDE